MKFRMLLLIAVILSGLSLSINIHADTAQQSSVPTPSIPQFTLKYVDDSYDVPSNIYTTTDPYTNQTTTTVVPGYRVTKFDINVTIKNQPFPSTINGNTTNLYYAAQYKGHYENWTDFSLVGEVIFSTLPVQSSSDYTAISYSAKLFPSNGEVDFRVKAILGYKYSYYNNEHIFPIQATAYVFQASDWSNTQTITLPASSPTPPLTANLSESASSLNYGSTLNFTVSTSGGTPPYIYTYNVDGQFLPATPSPYYSTNSSVGSHHVFVTVIDRNGNSANTLTVEFNVLPVSTSTSPGTSSSPSFIVTSPATQQPTLEPSSTPNFPRENLTSLAVVAGAVAAIAVVIALLAYLTRSRGRK